MADGQATGDAAPDGGSGGGNAKTPSDFLRSIKGKPVVVKLNSGVDYRGARCMSRCRRLTCTAAVSCARRQAPGLRVIFCAWKRKYLRGFCPL